jgi:hypothetical protein
MIPKSREAMPLTLLATTTNLSASNSAVLPAPVQPLKPIALKKTITFRLHDVCLFENAIFLH